MKLWKVSVLLVAAAMFAVPANAQDSCTTAVPNSTAVDPCGDTDPTGPLGFCAAGSGTEDVWVTFVATATEHRVRTDLNSLGTDSDYVIFSGDCAGLTPIGCSEDIAPGNYLGDTCVGGLTIGDTYTVQVGGWGGSCGPFTVDVEAATGTTCGDNMVSCVPGAEECDGTDDAACPGLCVNCVCQLPCPDTCAGAIDVGSAGSETRVDPCCDTDPTGPLAGACGHSSGTNDVWLSFVATLTEHRIRTDVQSNGTDSSFDVYSGTCGNLTLIACSEDDGAGFLGDVNVGGLTIGETYLIQLGSWADGCGTYAVNVEPVFGGVCGDGIRSPLTEDCDGADDGLCSGLCGTGDAATACSCPTPVCGNGTQEVGEQCDLGAGNGAVGCIIPDCVCTGDCKIATDIVPAVSEWGLVVMVLIGLAAGTVMFGRKRVATA